MPNKETFTIKPIRLLIEKYLKRLGKNMLEFEIVDPFVRDSIFKNVCSKTNDLNPNIQAMSNVEALEFLKTIEDETVDFLFFDPPYSPRQIKECYNNIGVNVHQEDTQSKFYSDKKIEIARVMKKGGIVLSCGWNSMGIGKTRGFEIIEILLVAHGGAKNDTIVTVEVKK